MEEKNLAQVDDTEAIEKAVDAVITSNPKAVEDFKKGKPTAAKAVMGQVMKISKGKANPQKVQALVEEELKKL